MSKLNITLHHELDTNALRGLVLGNERDDLLKFIAALDLAVEDWEFTEKLIAHFKAVEAEGLKSGELEGPVEPNKIKP